MEWINNLYPLLVSLFLLVFGAIVLWQGVNIIHDFYPKTLTLPKSGEQKTGNLLVGSLSTLVEAQTAELLTVQSENRNRNTIRVRAEGEAEPDASATETENPPEKEKTLFEGIATLTTAIKDLLGANFGPAALLVLTGLALLGGGVWLLYVNLLA